MKRKLKFLYRNIKNNKNTRLLILVPCLVLLIMLLSPRFTFCKVFLFSDGLKIIIIWFFLNVFFKAIDKKLDRWISLLLIVCVETTFIIEFWDEIKTLMSSKIADSYNLGELFKGLFPLIIAAPPAYMIWNWRDENKRKDQEHAERDLKLKENNDAWNNFRKYQEIVEDKKSSDAEKTSAIFALGEYYKRQEKKYPRMVHSFFKNVLATYWKMQEHRIDLEKGFEPMQYIQAVYETILNISWDNNLLDRKERNIFNTERLYHINFSNFKLLQANWKGVKLNNTVFIEADFRKATLFKANFKNSFLLRANFKKAKLIRRADLSEAVLTQADFREARMTNVRCRKTDLCGADLKNADLREADFREADLIEADLRGADFGGADLSGADLSKVKFDNKTKFKRAYYSKAHKRSRNTVFPEGFSPKEYDMICLSGNSKFPKLNFIF